MRRMPRRYVPGRKRPAWWDPEIRDPAVAWKRATRRLRRAMRRHYGGGA